MMSRFFLFILLSLLGINTSLTRCQTERIEIKTSSLVGRSGPILYQSFGMNAHLTFSCSNRYMDELCKSMSEAGVKIVRLDIYWSEKDMLLRQELYDKAAYYVTKYGMEVEFSMPQIPLGKDDYFLEKWCKTIVHYAKRYDGKTVINLYNGEEPRGIRINYFEIMNEPDGQRKNGLSVPYFFKLLKLSTGAIRSCRHDAKVVMPGLCFNGKFDKELFEYRDRDRKTVADYIDILNFHYYSDQSHDMWKSLNGWISLLHQNDRLKEKPIWMTEFGHSLWNVSEKNQARFLPKEALAALSLGVEKVFYYQYHQFGGNLFGDRDQKEDFFGIIHYSNDNSYGSFYRNDGKYLTALSEGDGSKRIYITNKNKEYFSLYTLTESICRELKENGVAIGGAGLTLNKVVLKKANGEEKLLCESKFKIPLKNKGHVLKLGPALFNDVKISDQLIVYISNVKKNSQHWSGINPLLAYNSYKTLSSKVDNSICPQLIENNYGITIFSWMFGTHRHYAVWANNGNWKLKPSQHGKIIKCYDYLDSPMKIDQNGIILSDNLIYIESDEELTFSNF